MEAWTKVVGNSRGRTSRGNRERMEEGLLLLLLLLLVQAVNGGCIMTLDVLPERQGPVAVWKERHIFSIS